MKKILLITDCLDWIYAGGAKAGGGAVVATNFIENVVNIPNVQLCVICPTSKIKEIKNVRIVFNDNVLKPQIFNDELEKFLQKEDFSEIFTINLPFFYKGFFLQCHSFVNRCQNEGFLINLLKRFLSNKKIKRQKKDFENIDKNAKFIAMSEIIKKDYEKNLGLNPENVFCIYPSCKIQEVEPEIKIQKEKPVFGIVANTSANKGGLLFILAFAVLKYFFDFDLKIVSPKLEKNKFVKILIKIFGLEHRTKILGESKNLNEFYKDIDFLVLPSKNEAFGLVVLEAMSFKTPCIVSNTAGCAEIIEKNSGLIFERKSFIDFIRKIVFSINIYKNDFETYKKYSQSAYEVSKKYNWQTFCEKIINICN